MCTVLCCHLCKQASLLFSRSSRAAAAATAGTTTTASRSTDKRSSVAVRGLRSASGATAGIGTAATASSVIDIGAAASDLSPRHTAAATAASTAGTAAHTRPLSAKRAAPTVLGDMEKVTLHSIHIYYCIHIHLYIRIVWYVYLCSSMHVMLTDAYAAAH
jgi:hypothetical protein